MRKNFTLLFLFLFSGYVAQAQLADGSVAPNFTATDLDGNTWTLYDLLDEGKTVYLDIMATWCGPCLNYKNTGAFQNLWSQYGPDGTDEVFAFMIEGDPNTTLADLYGTGNNTITNWTQGVNFPIIDDAGLGDLYDIAYFPTIYMVCPNRIVTEVGQLNTAGLYNAKGDCREATGANNGALLSFVGGSGSFCGNEDFTPVVNFQNMGTETIGSATFELIANGVSAGTQVFTGSLATYQFGEVTFDPLTITEDTDVEVNILDINGVADESADDNSLTTSLSLAPVTAGNLVTLTFTTDNFAAESYWELINSSGAAIYSGGNPGIFSALISLGAYDNATTYVHELPLPADDCYELRVYDFFGDGICCDYGLGSYTLEDADGNVLVSGGQFEDLASHPVQLAGAGEIVNNARIALYIGDQGSFCQVLPYTPQFTVQNVGNNEITSMEIEVNINGAVVETINWTGSLAPSENAIVGAQEVLVDEDSDVTFTITTVNGEADVYDYFNDLSVSLDRVPLTEGEVVIFEMLTDGYGYETYWEITDDAGTVLASGGNELVGATEGGDGVANGPGDPGAYGNDQPVFAEVTLPADGCYQVRVLDDYGDGICCAYGNGYYRLVDELGTVILEGGAFGAVSVEEFEREMTTSVPQLTELTELALFPNPARDEVTLQFSLAEPMPLAVSIYNTLGQRVRTISAARFVAGMHTLAVDTRDLSAGMYYLRLENGNRQMSRKLVIQR